MNYEGKMKSLVPHYRASAQPHKCGTACVLKESTAQKLGDRTANIETVPKIAHERTQQLQDGSRPAQRPGNHPMAPRAHSLRHQGEANERTGAIGGEPGRRATEHVIG